MKLSILFLLLTTTIVCGQNDYNLVPNESGILYEKFNPANKDENRFTKNNKIFRDGVTFKYAFEHLDSKDERYYFKYLDSLDNWQFVKESESDKETHKEVIISVQPGLGGFDRIDPDYYQTVISYEYPKENGRTNFSGASGVIENEANVWMHPPRDKYFMILEINPFPYIKAPYEIGNAWTWNLRVGDFWGDPRWKTWKGKVEIKYDYRITGKETVNLLIGHLECYVVKGIATSRLGNSSLEAYFHPDYGFVKLNYVNIDGSKTNLVLENYHYSVNSK